MKRWYGVIACVSLWVAVASACDLEDDAQQHLSFKTPVRRVVALSPHLAELVYAAGAGDSLVGVSLHSDYPSAVKSLTQVADYRSIDVEKIIQLKPDLVIAWDNDSTNLQLQQLQQFGIAVYYHHVKKLADISVFIRNMGCMANSEPIANRAADQFDRKLLIIKQTYSTKPPVSIFFELNEIPLMTLTKRSFINQAITLCGGNNLYANLPGLAPQVNPEAVIIANPEVFISTDPNSAWQAQWRRWPQLYAVKVDNFFTVDADLLVRPTPRLLEGIEELCVALDTARARAKR